MCGIAGYVIPENSPREITKESLVTMTHSLYHRGPDDEGYFWSPKVGLGSQRLSIIDLSPAGRMPILNETRTVAAMQNGEIYNFQELRSDLIEKGHRFIGKSDTEVVVHLYEEVGDRCFEQLDGMYAIAVWDAPRQRLLLARDRFGEKPLYYYVDSGTIAFASELKSLVLFPSFQREIDWDALEHFLTLGYILAPHTPYRNVYKLLPGHYLTFDQRTGAFEIQEYWALPDPTEAPPRKSEAEYLESFKDLFFSSVQSRLVSDVPVGAFLSGGIDSSLVVAAMAHLRSDPVRTFSIGFRFSQRHNENPVAEQVARSLGVEHDTLWADFQNVLEVIERLPWLWDEPLGDPALIGVYLITRFAKENGVTVMLSGDAGDELFFGYPMYTWIERLGVIYRLPAAAREGLAAGASLASWIFRNSRLKKAARVLKHRNFLQAAYDLAGYGAWSVEEVGRLRGRQVSNVKNERFTFAFNDTAPNPRPLLREAKALLTTYLPDNNLARMDRGSMANAVETRAPFLHPSIAEFGVKLPLDMKIRGSTLKYLLRKALGEFVAEDIVKRPKHGFDALPMTSWLRNELQFLVHEYLDATRLKRQGIFQPEVVEETVSQHMIGGRFNHWWKLWLLIVLQMWLESWAGIS